MMDLGCQRWREGSSCLRPSREIVSTRTLDVGELPELEAKAFVTRHHYSKRFPAARFRFALAGVAVFSRPFLAEVISNVFPDLAGDDAAAGVELGRFVLLDEVGANAETWFLARCFAALRGRVRGVVSFSDPTPRQSAQGEVFPGHVGTIYQASNARYLGRTDRRTLRLLPDGTVFSNFSSGKIRRGLVGWESAAAELERFGAPPLGTIRNKRRRIAWLNRWRGALTRGHRHEGLHRYAFRLDPATAIPYGPDLAYPKRAA